MSSIPAAVARIQAAPPRGRSAADALRALGHEAPWAWLALVELPAPRVDAAAALQGGARPGDEGGLVLAGGRS